MMLTEAQIPRIAAIVVTQPSGIMSSVSLSVRSAWNARKIYIQAHIRCAFSHFGHEIFFFACLMSRQMTESM